MKLQLTSFVTLAILYGTVTATPTPAEDQSISDSILGLGGNVAGSLWRGLVPSAALTGSAQGAGACIIGPNNQVFCPRDTESEDQSISDSILGLGGNVAGSLWRGLVPGAALTGSAQGANACIRGPNNQVFCPRDTESEDQSVSDSILGLGGNLASTIFKGIVPNSAFVSAVGGAGACIVGPNNQLFCPRDTESEDQSISDAILGLGGNVAGSLWRGLVPSAALTGSAQGANACIRGPNNQVFCPRDTESEDQSISDSILGLGGNVAGSLWRGLVPSAALTGSAQGAGACIIGPNNQVFCPRDTESEDQSVSDSILGLGGNLAGSLWRGLVPGAALRGSAAGAGACIIGPNNQVFCPSS